MQLSEDEKEWKTSEEEQLIEEDEKKAVEEHLAIKEELDEEHKLHETDVAKFNFQAKYMSGAEFKKKVGVLCGFKVIKFRKVWQSLFYLLGYKREEICAEATNMLDWKQAKPLFKADFYKRLTEYTPFGAKEGEFVPYQKIGWIEKNIAGKLHNYRNRVHGGGGRATDRAVLSRSVEAISVAEEGCGAETQGL